MEKIIAGVVTALIGVMIWYLKCQTNRQNKREDKRDERDIKREEKILNIVDGSLKNMAKVVVKDSENTEKMEKTVSGLKSIIQNGLIHAIKDLTTEIRGMNGKK